MADSFVVLPPATDNNCIIFGTNSHRPAFEVQEVILVQGQDHPEASKVKCTYIEVEQVTHTHAVILSKPAWAWGAEMGANEKGVCAVNQPIWNKLIGKKDLEKKLLGQDFVRLVLERCTTAHESIDLIGQLLSTYGQGGPCAEEGQDWSYHNSFLIADSKEAWVVETAGRLWVAQSVKESFRNLSNQLTIGSDYDLSSPDLVDQAKSLDLYKDEDGTFHFSKVFSEKHAEDDANSDSRYEKGKQLLENHCSKGKFTAKDMMDLLRNEELSILLSGPFQTTGSQVSVIAPEPATSCHWFTATPIPKLSIFKPFIFCPQADIGGVTRSPVLGIVEPLNQEARFHATGDRRHSLWKGHEKFRSLIEKEDPSGLMVLENVKELENNCVEDMNEMLKNFDEKGAMKVMQIFVHIATMELNFYK